MVSAGKASGEGQGYLGYRHSTILGRRFVELVVHRNIVFEFTISEKRNGSIRNYGYPWRLIRSEFLDQLFAFQIKLR